MIKNKIKVAVIDTGLTEKYLVKDIRLQKYISMKQSYEDASDMGKVEIAKGIYSRAGEKSSHGTRVVNTIKKYARNAPVEFYIYDVFDNLGKSSGAVVLEALKMILEDDVDIIVMSLTCGSEYKSDFERLATIIEQKNILFICSASNDGQCNCPADLEFVYGVSGKAIGINGRYRYTPTSKLQFWSDIQWEFVGELEQLQVFCGTSKATAVIAGRLIDYMYQHGKEDLFQYLMDEHDEFTDIPPIDIDDESIDKELLQIYCQVYGLEKEICMNNLDTIIPWHQNNIDKFVIFMKRIGLEKVIWQLNYTEFITLRNILKACKIRMKNV